MIVANKFQTGFDQPRLCAMYVDRRLKDVDCVQTLSRLNRTFPGKEAPFVLDFVNDADDIRAAFAPYYNTAELTDVSDPNVVYDLLRKLNEARIYEWHEVESFARAFFDPKAKSSKLSYWVEPARQRFKTQYDDATERARRAQQDKKQAEDNGDRAGAQRAEHELKEAGEARDALETFRKDLQSFVRTYEFLSQVLEFDDRELEQLCVYARHLHPLLETRRLSDDELDLSELELTHYRLNKRAERRIELGEEEGDYTLKPVTDVGSGQARDPKQERLDAIIERLNDLFGAEVDDRDKLNWAQNLADRVRRDDAVMEQARTHSDEQMMRGRYPEILEKLVIDSMNDNEKLATEVLEREETMSAFARLVLELARNRQTDSVTSG